MRARIFLLLGTLLCCLFVPVLPGTGSAQALSKVAITYPGRNIFFIDLYIAQARGFFRDEGLDAQLVLVRPNLAMAAAIAGPPGLAQPAVRFGRNARFLAGCRGGRRVEPRA